MLAYSKFQIPVSNSNGHDVLSDGADGRLHYISFSQNGVGLV